MSDENYAECFNIACEECVDDWLDCDLSFDEKEDAFAAGWNGDENPPDFGHEYDYVDSIFNFGKRAKACKSPTQFRKSFEG